MCIYLIRKGVDAKIGSWDGLEPMLTQTYLIRLRNKPSWVNVFIAVGYKSYIYVSCGPFY